MMWGAKYTMCSVGMKIGKIVTEVGIEVPQSLKPPHIPATLFLGTHIPEVMSK